MKHKINSVGVWFFLAVVLGAGAYWPVFAREATTYGWRETLPNGDVVEAFTNTAAKISWTVPSGVSSVRYLVVGGGGASGMASQQPSGGGGGGAVKKGSSLLVSAGQVATIQVGAGGKPQTDTSSYSVQGTAGGTSSLSLGGEEIVALGGGVGAVGRKSSSDMAKTPGATGGVGLASGGGASGRKPALEYWLSGAYAGDGFRGGQITGENNNPADNTGVAGGGGGAGGQGGDITQANVRQGSAGGVGVTDDITGSSVMYGAGGGGGGSSGNGARGDGTTTTDGAPSSGAGANGVAWNEVAAQKLGGVGGSGVVILRYASGPSPTPVVAWAGEIVSATAGEVTLPYAVTTLGEGASSASIWAEYGLAGATDQRSTAKAVTTVGGETLTLSGLDLGSEYTFVLVLSNNLHALSRTSEKAFTLGGAVKIVSAVGSATKLLYKIEGQVVPGAGETTVELVYRFNTGADQRQTVSLKADGRFEVQLGAQGHTEADALIWHLEASNRFAGKTYTARSEEQTLHLQGDFVDTEYGWRKTIGFDVVEVFTNVSRSFKWTVPSGVTSLRYLVVGGGGASGLASQQPGGGGGGGAVKKGAALSVSAGQEVTVQVGVGGAPALDYKSAATRSGASTLSVGSTTITAPGGGAGAIGRTSSSTYDEQNATGGSSYGSGGGASGHMPTLVYLAGGVYPGEGFRGGQITGNNKPAVAATGAACGGGGAGGNGGDINASAGFVYVGSTGGVGIEDDITGASAMYGAGGGGGGSVSCGVRGDGTSEVDGATATGAGANGLNSNAEVKGGSGGSGVVVLRYLADQTVPHVTLDATEVGLDGSISLSYTLDSLGTGSKTAWVWATLRTASTREDSAVVSFTSQDVGEVCFAGCEPETDYTVSVTASNLLGRVQTTEAVVVRTLGGASIARVQGVPAPTSFTFTGAVTPGIGQTQALLNYRFGEGDWELCPLALDGESSFSQTLASRGADAVLSWFVSVTNTYTSKSTRTYAWGNQTEIGELKPMDAPTTHYTWQATSLSPWDSALSWHSSAVPCVGYPRGDATAAFGGEAYVDGAGKTFALGALSFGSEVVSLSNVTLQVATPLALSAGAYVVLAQASLSGGDQPLLVAPEATLAVAASGAAVPALELQGGTLEVRDAAVLRVATLRATSEATIALTSPTAPREGAPIEATGIVAFEPGTVLKLSAEQCRVGEEYPLLTAQGGFELTDSTPFSVKALRAVATGVERGLQPALRLSPDGKTILGVIKTNGFTLYLRGK